jgi:cyclophilin family peptidyl-prolyl cis-trans isomerase
MGTAKRERQKQGRQARLAQAQAEAAKKKRTRSLVLLGGVVVVLVGATLALGGLGGDDDDPVEAGSGGSTTSTTPAGPTITVPAAGASITGATPCPAADGSSERTTSFAEAPPTCIDPAKTYTATLTTSMGDIELALDPAAAPITVNNFVVLARYHYYDGVAFHRIIPQFMIQTGDAVGPQPGSGSPGYTIPDELPTGEDAYPPGTLAMANTSAPDTGGSQFFIMATGSSGLNPSYSVFGSVTAGQDVVDAINQLGDAATNGTPTEEVLVESVTITEA